MEITRETLFDPVALEEAQKRFGGESEIKLEADRCEPTVYEIRTALQFWFGGQDHRTSRAFAERLRWHEEEGVPPKEALKL